MANATAAEEAASWLRFAHRGYEERYGSVPLDARMEIARAWIDLARVELGTTCALGEETGR